MIEELLKQYQDVLMAELQELDALDAATARAYLSGEINGTNDKTRRAQEFDAIRTYKMSADLATALRKIVEARISLVKAELYSRAQIA